MKLTAELSLYPLHDDYIPVIQGFIDQLAADSELKRVTNAMSTQISGDSDRVFEVINRALKHSVDICGTQILVCKFITRELDIAG